MTITSDELVTWISAYFWPFVRITALLMASPFFGTMAIIPARIRMVLALALTWVLVPVIPPAPVIDPLSAVGLLVLAQQLLFGFAMGFLLQLAFTALTLGGSSISMPMGLGFANVIDPQNGVQVPVLSTLFTIMGTLLFLSLNGHLILIQVLADSFTSMPVGPVGLSTENLMRIVLWGTRVFVGGVLIALPAIMIITLINISFGIMTRAAPQLNIFAVGFPTTMAAGFLVLFLTMPNLLPHFTSLLYDAFDVMQGILTGG